MTVVDASVLLSALAKKGATFYLLFRLYEKGVLLASPKLLIEEINSKLPKISQITKLYDEEIKFMLKFLREIILIVEESKFLPFIKKRRKFVLIKMIFLMLP